MLTSFPSGETDHECPGGSYRTGRRPLGAAFARFPTPHRIPGRRVQLAVEDRSNCMTTMARSRPGQRGGAIAARRRHL